MTISCKVLTGTIHRRIINFDTPHEEEVAVLVTADDSEYKISFPYGVNALSVMAFHAFIGKHVKIDAVRVKDSAVIYVDDMSAITAFNPAGYKMRF